MGRRFASAFLILALLAGLCWLDLRWNFGRPGVWLAPLAIAIACLAVTEMLRLLRAQNLRPLGWVAYASTLLVLGAAIAPVVWPDAMTFTPCGWSMLPLVAVALGVCLALVGEVRRYEKPGGVLIHVALSVFTMTYIGLLMSFFAALRLMGDSAFGMVALLSMIVVAKSGDVGALFVGRALGRNKLAPRLSPGKTVEGAVGAVVAGGLVSLAFFFWVAPAIAAPSVVASNWGWLVFGVLVSTAGMIGDIAESLIKRDMEQKDSGNWVPGMGGVLDVIDSLLIAAPVAYLCWAAGVVP